jgi:branched-chain amino acid transport system substrate-binding protein
MRRLGVALFFCLGLMDLGAEPRGTNTNGAAPAIDIGMSTALSGPAADLGRSMLAGIKAGLEEVNRAGGIRGRMLSLIVLDDGYEPARTAPQMRRLVEEEKVLAVIGNVGTPTAVAALPIVAESQTPFIAPFTGAGILRRTPPDRYVVNFRASYAEETGAMVDALVQEAGIRPEQIAFFTQRDAYGDAGFAGGVAALKRHGVVQEMGIPHVRYERNTMAVERALADLLLLDPLPRAVIIVGAYAPSAAFIRQAREHALDALFLNVSFVGPSSLLKDLGPAGEGVIITAVVPHPESDLPGVQAYRAAMHIANPGFSPNFGSLEGYLAARMLGDALRRHEGPLTREGVIDALEALGQFDLGLGIPLRLSPTEHQASHAVWPTIIRGGRIVPFDWKEWSSRRPRSP